MAELLLQDIDDAIRIADQAGRTDDVLRLAEERNRIMQGGGQPAVPQPDTGITKREALQQATQGLSLGFGEELTAGLAALLAKTEPGEQPFMETFRDILEAERGQIAQTQEQHPVASTLLQIGGGLATGGVGATRAAGAKVFQGAATRGGQIAQKVGSAAAAGVPAGAVFGAGTAEGGLPERAVGAAEGAAIGAVGGAALRPVIAGLTKGVKLGAQGVRGAVRILTKTDADKANATIAQRLLRDDSATVVRQNLRELGEGATIPDAAGEATRIELERVAALPASRNQIVKAVTERLNGTRSRIASDVREIFTPGSQTFDETVAEITRKASEKASPLYARAYAAKVDNTAPALKELLKNPRIRKAIPKALDRIKSKTVGPDDPERAAILAVQKGTQRAAGPKIIRDPSISRAKQAAQDGVPDEVKAALKEPTMIVWDHVKRVLSDQQFKAFSKQPGLARDIGKNLRELTAALDSQVPAYGQARKIWAGGKEAENAFEAGTEVLGGLTRLKTGAKASIRTFNDLSDASKQLYRTGVGQDIENTLLTVGDDATESLVKQIAGNPAKRKVLKNAMPDAAQRKQFLRTLTSERDFAKNANEALKGSRSELRRTLKDEDKASMGTIFSNLIAGQFALSGNQFAQLRLVSSLAGKTGSLSDKANILIGKKLTETRGAEINKTLNEIDRLIGLPKSLKEAQKSSNIVKFMLDNPDAARKFNETASAVTAAVMADKRSREQ